jgi:hypothetical protein
LLRVDDKKELTLLLLVFIKESTGAKSTVYCEKADLCEQIENADPQGCKIELKGGALEVTCTKVNGQTYDPACVPSKTVCCTKQIGASADQAPVVNKATKELLDKAQLKTDCTLLIANEDMSTPAPEPAPELDSNFWCDKAAVCKQIKQTEPTGCIIELKGGALKVTCAKVTGQDYEPECESSATKCCTKNGGNAALNAPVQDKTAKKLLDNTDIKTDCKDLKGISYIKGKSSNSTSPTSPTKAPTKAPTASKGGADTVHQAVISLFSLVWFIYFF